MRKRFDELRKDQKGFTLVELIVVLVILAIMAALLAPALLGYIDKARDGKYLEECRSISTATQAIMDEHYAKNTATAFDTNASNNDMKSLNKLVYPTNVTAMELEVRDSNGTNDKKDKYILKNITSVTFKSQDENTIVATQAADGEWTITSITAPASNAGNNNNNNNNNTNP